MWMHHNLRVPFGVIILMFWVIKHSSFHPGEFLPAKSQSNKSIGTIAFTCIRTIAFDRLKAGKYLQE